MSERELFDILIVVGFISAALVFVSLFFITAPYGRYVRTGWGPTIDNTLGWIIMETPAALATPLLILTGTNAMTPVLWAFVVVWCAHYLHRTYVFPFRLRTKGKRMPVTIVGSAIVFNLFNGYLNGRYLGEFAPPYPANWLTDPRFIIGVTMFFAGMYVNIRSDQILFNLRKPGNTGYSIPRGGLYRWISCPNYFGELLEWFGWAILTWSISGLVFAVWTAANLVPRAVSNHRWYRERFPEYPANRRAVLPFVL